MPALFIAQLALLALGATALAVDQDPEVKAVGYLLLAASVICGAFYWGG